MKLIYDIAKKLKKQEIRQIRHKLAHSAFEFEKAEKLFELVTRYEEKDESFYSQKLYGREPENTFRVAKSRLKRILENVILNDKSLSGYRSAAINSKLKAKKRLLQGEILLGRGAYLASRNLLQQVISSARKFQFHDILFQAELLLYRNYSIRTSVTEFEKQTAELLEMNRTNALINEAQILHYAISNLLLNLTPEKEQLTDVRKQVDRMREISEITGHPLVKNVYYRSEIYYLQVAAQYEAAISFCKKYIDLLKTEPSQYSQTLMGGAYIQLAQTSLQLGRIAESRDYAGQALGMYSPEEMNHLVVLELKFRIAFYADEFGEAAKYIEQALSHPQFNASRMLSAKWHYFHTCLLFKMGKYREAAQKLNDTAPLLADKYGMNLHIRLLEIMIMYELRHYDLMETKIQNMRQFIKRSQKNSELYRPMILIRILMEWFRKSYDFGKTLPSIRTKLQELKTFHDENPFRTSDFELIRLELWMEEKIKLATNL
jgi:tetratricopeptide (TPR) repeat protein